MHTTQQQSPSRDLGFVVDNERNLICALPIGSQPQAGTGLVRDTAGNTNFDGSDPSVGFLVRDTDDNLTFRTI